VHAAERPAVLDLTKQGWNVPYAPCLKVPSMTPKGTDGRTGGEGREVTS
jgi:hypothetical protein